MRPEKLSAEQCDEYLTSLVGWELVGKREAIRKRFQFRDFSRAFGWMARVALMAEKLDHHPEWNNVYGRVDVVLSTHDAGGLTDLDFRLARFMDEAVS